MRCWEKTPRRTRGSFNSFIGQLRDACGVKSVLEGSECEWKSQEPPVTVSLRTNAEVKKTNSGLHCALTAGVGVKQKDQIFFSTTYNPLPASTHCLSQALTV